MHVSAIIAAGGRGARFHLRASRYGGQVGGGVPKQLLMLGGVPILRRTVDALLRGYPLPPEVRTRDEKGSIQIEKTAPAEKSRMESKETKTPRRGRTSRLPMDRG